jgi:23S rRNA (cytosine1962-C5)-methyltransferase
VGFFAEQREVWGWLRETTRRAKTGSSTPLSVLNLFAYTGGSTFACALEGAAVTHVDASKTAVAWARRNALLSGLEVAPVRWIVDDVVAFTAREGRRGRAYDGVVLDPPSYGHGAGGQRWTLADGLPSLLDACLVAAPRPAFLVLTAHSEGVTPDDLAEALAAAFSRAGMPRAGTRVEALELELEAESGAVATAGVMARWRGNSGQR